MVRLSLELDMSLSVTFNNHEFKSVLSDLPDTPVYVIISMYVRKIQIVQPGIESYNKGNYIIRVVIGHL